MEEQVPIVLPKLGESITFATVVQWFKKVGDFVAMDEALLEVSTDKVNSEIPSPVSGILSKISVSENEVVDVGTILAYVKQSARPSSHHHQEMTTAASAEQENAPPAGDYFSPAVLSMAQQEKIPLQELQKIPGTGNGGRVTKRDIADYLQQKAHKEQPARPAPDFSEKEDVTIKMSGIRKAIADTMIRSHREIPHAFVAFEVDVTRLVESIKEEKESFFQKTGVKLTITSYLIWALSRALRQFPYLNATVEGDVIVTKKNINIGFAVALEPDGILVPVIRDSDKLDLEQIACQLSDLSQRARIASLGPQDVQAGTITLTNFGMAGALLGLPIIRPPEVAIVGAGAILKKPVVVDDMIALRSVMQLTLSFDHRVVDGLYACGFMSHVKQLLEK